MRVQLGMSDRPYNPISDLVELSSRLEVRSEKGTTHLRTEARIGQADIDTPVGSLAVRRVFIQLQLEGYFIKPGIRYGEPIAESLTEKTKKTEEVVSSRSAGGQVGFNVNSIGTASLAVGAKASGEQAKKTKAETSSTTTKQLLHVKARGGNRWEIRSPDGSHLNGTYLTDDTILCELDKSKGANQNSLIVHGLVRRRDLEFIPIRPASRFSFSPNKEKILNAFLSKKISPRENGNDETITISYQEIHDE